MVLSSESARSSVEPRSRRIAHIASSAVDEEGLVASRIARPPRATGLPSILPSDAPGLQLSVRTVVASSTSLPALPSSTSRARVRYDFGRAAPRKTRVGPPKQRRELIQWGREIDARCAAAFGPQWALGWEAALVAHLGRDTP